jgi:uncharacterized damage-inducible protein DinB
MLAEQVNDARQRLLASVDGLSDDDMTEPGVKGEWSVRDILCNITAWDRTTTECFRAMLAGERHPLLDMGEDEVEEFEQANYRANKDKPPAEALDELTNAREELVTFLRDVPNTEMFAPAPGDEHADMSIAACLAVTVSLDEDNAEAIEEWRNTVGDE